jgi:hypothetical protein
MIYDDPAPDCCPGVPFLGHLGGCRAIKLPPYPTRVPVMATIKFDPGSGYDRIAFRHDG